MVLSLGSVQDFGRVTPSEAIYTFKRARAQYATLSNLLAPIYRWFIEGITSLNLIEAKALLDELS